MKKLILFTLLTALMVACFSLDADAQSRKKKKKKKKPQQDEYFDESGNFASKLWYGAGGSLGFNSFNGQSDFNIGISPMVGYKIIEPISVGLRTELDYYYSKIIGVGNNLKYQSLSYGVGPFTRARFWRLFFHGEYMYENQARPYDENNRGPFLDPDDDTKIQSFRFPQDKLNIGLGYNSGEILSFEAYILYNVLTDLQDNESPWDIRFGLTYQF